MLTGEAEGAETGIEKFPILETMLPDMGACTDSDVVNTESTVVTVVLETTLESTGDSDTGGIGGPLEVITLMLVAT